MWRGLRHIQNFLSAAGGKSKTRSLQQSKALSRRVGGAKSKSWRRQVEESEAHSSRAEGAKSKARSRTRPRPASALRRSGGALRPPCGGFLCCPCAGGGCCPGGVWGLKGGGTAQRAEKSHTNPHSSSKIGAAVSSRAPCIKRAALAPREGAWRTAREDERGAGKSAHGLARQQRRSRVP